MAASYSDKSVAGNSRDSRLQWNQILCLVFPVLVISMQIRDGDSLHSFLFKAHVEIQPALLLYLGNSLFSLNDYQIFAPAGIRRRISHFRNCFNKVHVEYVEFSSSGIHSDWTELIKRSIQIWASKIEYLVI